MAHAPGWIELYELLESTQEPPMALVDLCRSGRTQGTRETILHWYAVEGEPAVVQRMIDLGFDVDALDASGSTPLYLAASLESWEMVRTLRRAGARVSGVNTLGLSYRSKLCEAGPQVPADLRGDLYDLEDLLLPGGPEQQRVAELFLTRAGVPATAPGQALTRESWTRFARLALACDLKDPLGVGGHECCELVEDRDCWGPPPGVLVSYPAELGLRAAYRIAQHFGTRVLWTFECGPAPDLGAA
ncbi:MAG: ankyrin repeat domain-containing protein [Planctomycetota bacterium]